AISGPWNASGVQEALGDNFGVTTLPTINVGGSDKPLQCFANLKLMGVNSHTKYPKSASALAEWLTNAENQATRAKLRSLGAVNTTVDASAFADNATLAAVSAQSAHTTPAIHVSMIGNYWDAMQTLGDALIPTGSATKEDMQSILDTTVTGITTGIANQ
ncbi:MAG: extracellular solute-binding protein, partial [Muribaculum sp.]|nr:extracellular solute-binding protein [Muribaculum sp.]